MIITAKNGKEYEIRGGIDGNLEIERDDEVTGLRRVFVFQDLSIGNYTSKRREAVFYSYDISPTNERINEKRYSFKDDDIEFSTFFTSEAWEFLKDNIIGNFLRKIEFTEESDS